MRLREALTALLALSVTLAPLSASELVELEALTLEQERRGLIAPDFGAWERRYRPHLDWESPHFGVLHSHLDRITARALDRLILQISIRHGKTESLTGYMAYRLDLDPSLAVLFGTYAERHAHKLSRAVKRLAVERGVRVSRDRDAAGEWETVEGGGVLAVGAGTGVASVNAGLIVIDDPIGSRAEAESQAHRDRVWDWITTDILARATPETQVIFSMPRWHEDDPSGRLQDQHGDRWALIDLPGVAEAGDMLGREEGELLWPSHRPQSWIDERRIELGSYGFASAVQCRPRPREGRMFEWDWWLLLPEAPVCGKLVRYWDLAGTQPKRGKSDPDFSAGTLGGVMADGRTCILHQAAAQKSIAERDAWLERIARRDRERYGHAVEWWFEREAGVGGSDRMESVVRRIQRVGLKVSTEPATGSKVLRAEPLASAAEAGNVVLAPDDPDEPWHDDFRQETVDFPDGGKHDDRVDSAAGMQNKLALAPGPVRHARAPSPWG